MWHRKCITAVSFPDWSSYMLASERIAIAAHLHVQLRRQTGRVTDTEWMAMNPEYADEVVRIARESAKERGVAELAELAQKLEAAMLPLRRPPVPKTAGRAEAAPVASPAAQMQDRYVGRLR